ncbi:hypothetical protein NPIL_243761 [Nephila pilipes]|uniref:Uncharacterized protein n=1 Tax=Nephila pilipes TaxID=299642 RepID=A0A8X6IJ06_NEPPI|nr:hypothetical protein NPIL_243761 [Nephila pilipes]
MATLHPSVMIKAIEKSSTKQGENIDRYSTPESVTFIHCYRSGTVCLFSSVYIAKLDFPLPISSRNIAKFTSNRLVFDTSINKQASARSYNERSKIGYVVVSHRKYFNFTSNSILKHMLEFLVSDT